MIEPGAGKPLRWLHGEIRSPPFLLTSRHEAGRLLRRLQAGERMAMPHSRPMPSIGARCHELRVADASHAWRIIYRIDDDAIVILDVFPKTTRQTPARVIEACRARCRHYDASKGG
jgi:phage-related protein